MSLVLVALVVGLMLGLWLRSQPSIDWLICTIADRLKPQGQKFERYDLADSILNQPLRAETCWANLGDWTSATSYPEACEALAHRLARLANLEPGQHMLDLGFGLGEQIKFWYQYYQPAKVTGLNPSKSQLNFAQAYLETLGSMHPGLKLLGIGAEELDHLESSYDRIVSLDAAYHFPDRYSVLTKAREKLMPSGYIAFTDMLRTQTSFWPGSLLTGLLCLGGIPRANQIDKKQLYQQLQSLGYEDIVIEDISAAVFQGMEIYLKDFLRQRHQELRGARLQRYYATWNMLRFIRRYGGLSYVVYRARSGVVLADKAKLPSEI